MDVVRVPSNGIQEFGEAKIKYLGASCKACWELEFGHPVVRSGALSFVCQPVEVT